MKLIIEDAQHVYFTKGYVYRILFNSPKGVNFEDWCNELTVYKR
jgi:hypothetical protein